MNGLRHSALCGTAILLLLFGGAYGLRAQNAGKGEPSGTPAGKDTKPATDATPTTDSGNASLNVAAVASDSNPPAPAAETAANDADEGTADPQAPASAGSGPGAVPPVTRPGFFTRWGQAYVADWHGNSPGTDPKYLSPRRGFPPPIVSPPFPSTDWPIGGTPLIGAPDTQAYILMQAINENKSRSKWYGWASIGANGSSNNRGNAQKGIPANFPSAYDEFPNTVVLDQLAVYYERIPNEAQKEHFDWGWRLSGLYGQDYRFTTSKGMLSQQLLVKNSQYGFDPVMFYADFYFPHVADGMNLRVGRYISLPDIEAQLAPNNYTYSHSILYTFDCYTQLGVNATVKINNHWTVQGGISPGCDVMPWTTDAKVTGNVCVVYTWSNGGNALNTCDNTINNGKYGYNNLTAFYETWYHKFNAHWHTDTEAWYQYMRETPNMYWYNGTDPATGIQYANTPQTPWPEAQNYRPGGGASTLNFGAICTDPRLPASSQQSRCYAPEWAITNYVEHNFWKNQASLNIRNEFVDDIKGQRTGTPGRYEEHMVGLNFWVGSTVTFRPEVSFTKYYGPWGLRALDISPGSAVANLQNGNYQQGKTYAGTLAADLIWHF
jgi:Putative beta-barrel porin-2, OmpL-like. bbp2